MRDIAEVLRTSRERHGSAASARYERLIELAFDELRCDPQRPATRAVGGGDLHVYALRFPARRMPASEAVHSPPHLVAYRFDDAVVQIVRVLHEAMDLPMRLREAI